MPSEADTRANDIDPALARAGWTASHIIREYYFTDGRKLSGNQRGKRCFIDYLLHHNHHHLAIIEAKKSSEHPTKGLQQAIDYAKKLQIRFVFSSNGKEIYAFDLAEGKGAFVEQYPSPAELLAQSEVSLGLGEQLRQIPFLLDGAMQARYYQALAVNAATDAIAQGNPRILLTLATGTGKTFIAFQLVHKLFQTRWNLSAMGTRRPRILFLADRNILADQAINTFNPYEKDLVKIDGDEIRKRNGKVPTNAHIFFAIYQAISDKETIGGYYQAYPADFFDLILIDECHRGSANEEGSWRAILDHFRSAVHLGLTATPKRSDNVDTYAYFGQPVFEYSLKEGINDGFLTPYRVKRIKTNLDELILTDSDQVIGELDSPMIQVTDYDRKVRVDARTELVAKAILEHINPMEKTIVFCENQEHALIMRDMINQHKPVKDAHYCVRVTSDEGKIGKSLLEQFQDIDQDIPTIVTSSQMLTTGVDARNVRHIVLDRSIGSMVEFKQIVGRGTRIAEGKDYFTILDFRGATNKFYDADWDGEPEASEEKSGKESSTREPASPNYQGESAPKKAIVTLGKNREIKVIDVEIRYIDESGRPLSIQAFVERLVQSLPSLFTSLDDFREQWSDPDQRERLLVQLQQFGFDQEQLARLRHSFSADACDLFDLLAFLVFEQDMITRHQRANAVRDQQAFFDQFHNDKAKHFLDFILSRYEEVGSAELARDRLPTLIELSGLGTIRDAGQAFGGNAGKVLQAFKSLQSQIYTVQGRG